MLNKQNNFATTTALVLLGIISALTLITIWKLSAKENADWIRVGLNTSISTYMLVAAAYLCVRFWQQASGSPGPARPRIFWIAFIASHYVMAVAFSTLMGFIISTYLSYGASATDSLSYFDPIMTLIEPLIPLLQSFIATGIALLFGGRGLPANDQNGIPSTTTKVVLISIGSYLASHMLLTSAVWYTQGSLPMGYLDLEFMEVSAKAVFQLGIIFWALVATAAIWLFARRMIDQLKYFTTFFVGLVISTVSFLTCILVIKLFDAAFALNTVVALAIFSLTFLLTCYAASMIWVRLSQRA